MKMDPIPSMKRSRLVVKSPVTGILDVSVVGLDVADGFGDAVGLADGLAAPPPCAFAVGDGEGEGELDGFPVVFAESDDVNSRLDEPLGFVDGEGLGEPFSICKPDFGDVKSPGALDPEVFRKS